MRKTALITGTSSGIGLATAKIFLEAGYVVFAAQRLTKNTQELYTYARDAGLVDHLHFIELAISENDSVKKAFNKIQEATDHIDVLVNNAGFGYVGAIADMTTEEVIDQFETNVIGTHRIIRAVLPLVESVKGTIINIGSISGMVTFPLSGIYCASKHALESYTESLWMELRPLGVHVYLVEPGAISTNFYTKSMKKTRESTYMKRYQSAKSVRTIAGKGRTSWRSSPDVVARKIYQLALQKPFMLRHFVGRYSTIFPLARKLLPTEIFYWILEKLL